MLKVAKAYMKDLVLKLKEAKLKDPNTDTEKHIGFNL